MAYIAPNSTVHILRGIPWNNTYRDTPIFQSATAQYTYMVSKIKYTFSNQTYQRASRNSIKLNRVVEDFYDCNYIMFQNTSYGNKWFYGFITNVEYINNDTTRITYVLDVLQTWHFDYTLKSCFIERQHTPTDAIGEHLLDNNLELGELCINNQAALTDSFFHDWVIVVASLVEATYSGGTWTIGQDNLGEMQDNCYSATNYLLFDSSTDVNDFINAVTAAKGSADDILGIFMYPKGLISVDSQTGEMSWNTGFYDDSFITLTKPGCYGTGSEAYNSLDGYSPANKRLYSYPYSQILVTDGGNQVVTLRPELFKGSQGQDSDTYSFGLIAEKAYNPTVALLPKYYKFKIRDGNVKKFDPLTAIMMNGMPLCDWQSDTFKAYVAQTYGGAFAQATPQKTGTAIRAAGYAGSMATVTGAIGHGMRKVGEIAEESTAESKAHDRAMGRHGISYAQADTTADALKYGGEFLESVSDKVKEISTHFIEANQSHGRASDTALVNFSFKGFHIYEMCPKYEFARMIDSYFTMFGYEINMVGVPNREARPRWTFVKTLGCKIDGSIPFDHESVICSIYDSGVTFWKNPDEMYSYGLDNSPSV